MSHQTRAGAALVQEVETHLCDTSRQRLLHCLDALTVDEIWRRPNTNSNSVGNLVLHLCGNVRQWICSGLGGAPDQRVRNKEFSEKGPVPTVKLKQLVEDTLEDARTVLRGLDPASLMHVRPVQAYEQTGVQILVHVAEHFSYHVGQITYYVKAMKDIDTRYYAGQPLDQRAGGAPSSRPHLALRQRVAAANRALVEHGLVMGTFGNASAIARDEGVIAIKASGVPYDRLDADGIALVDLHGELVGSGPRPSSDTATHMLLYQAFPQIGGIVHTHSHYATCWAQACRPIPCLGTTHADHFFGDVPVTEPLTDDEIAGHYEQTMGETILRRLAGLDPLHHPAVLIANHGPVTWGETVEKAVEAAVVLEEVAHMALDSMRIAGKLSPIRERLHQRHFLRKHGPNAYYGQW